MTNIFTGLKELVLDLEPDFVKAEPAVTAWALNGGVAVLLGTVVGLTHTQEASVTTILTGLVALYTMTRTKEFTVSAFTGVLTTAVVAAGAFGLHLSGQDIGLLVSAVAAVTGLLLRANVSPSAAPPVQQAFVGKHEA
jgi:uncharacterized membrane protein YjjP (DUF1212 family)